MRAPLFLALSLFAFGVISSQSVIIFSSHILPEADRFFLLFLFGSFSLFRFEVLFCFPFHILCIYLYSKIQRPTVDDRLHLKESKGREERRRLLRRFLQNK